MWIWLDAKCLLLRDVCVTWQARLDAQLSVNSDETRQRQEAIAHELEKIMRRQQQLEATNEHLQEKAIDIRRSLNDLELTDAQYQQLRMCNEDDVTLKDFVAVCRIDQFKGELNLYNKWQSDDLFHIVINENHPRGNRFWVILKILTFMF